MAVGYEFSGVDSAKKSNSSKQETKIRTIIIKLKGETYSIKIQPITKTKNVNHNKYSETITIPIEVTNDNIHKEYLIEATEENNDNDTADCLMGIFKKQLISAIKDFVKEKRKIKVFEEFNSRLDKFSLTEDDVAVEEL